MCIYCIVLLCEDNVCVFIVLYCCVRIMYVYLLYCIVV